MFQQAVRHCVPYTCSIVANKYDCTRLYIGYCYEYIALQDVCRSLTENTSRKIYLYDMILGLSAITKNPTDTTHNRVLRVLFTHSDEMRVFFPMAAASFTSLATEQLRWNVGTRRQQRRRKRRRRRSSGCHSALLPPDSINKTILNQPAMRLYGGGAILSLWGVTLLLQTAG